MGTINCITFNNSNTSLTVFISRIRHKTDLGQIVATSLSGLKTKTKSVYRRKLLADVSKSLNGSERNPIDIVQIVFKIYSQISTSAISIIL